MSVIKSFDTLTDGEYAFSVKVLGIPFGGPVNGAYDLHGERFTKNTNIGDGVGTVYSFLHHGYDTEIAKKFGVNALKEQIGIARKLEMTDEGWLYEILVKKSYKYKKVLKALYDQGLLGVSSGAIPVSVIKDEDGKTIKQWFPDEISFTVSPANPATLNVIKSMEDDMEDIQKEKEAEVNPITDSFTKALDAASDEVATENAKVELENKIGEIHDMFNKMLDRMATLEVSYAKTLQVVDEGMKGVALSIGQKLAEPARPFQAPGTQKTLTNDKRQTKLIMPGEGR